jgi:hypothetical protein
MQGGGLIVDKPTMSVCMNTTDYQKRLIEWQKERIEELEQALKDIKRHQKIISGGMYEQTGAWQIASKAL